MNNFSEPVKPYNQLSTVSKWIVDCSQQKQDVLQTSFYRKKNAIEVIHVSNYESGPLEMDSIQPNTIESITTAKVCSYALSNLNAIPKLDNLKITQVKNNSKVSFLIADSDTRVFSVEPQLNDQNIIVFLKKSVLDRDSEYHGKFVLEIDNNKIFKNKQSGIPNNIIHSHPKNINLLSNEKDYQLTIFCESIEGNFSEGENLQLNLDTILIRGENHYQAKFEFPIFANVCNISSKK
jgi:hypothetical protein